MDRLESLSTTLQNITLYDIKSMYNQAKNVVLNVSEMEAKVREATNDDPWGASSTLMQEIAQGTFSFQHFNEIMPCIYARFMEKEARQWRQIYKALQLLEYLIKHGSERVVDDARSHISTLKMLRNFHYIDDKGKDEGINVRNRSRELVELLSDVEKIRGERRKAKTNKSKYVGVGNDGMTGMSFSGSGGRYGGFGSDSLGGGSGSSYGNDYGGGGSYGAGGSGNAGGFSDNNGRRGYEEYNAGDDEVPHTTTPPTLRSSNSIRNTTRKASAPAAPPPAPVEDLLGGFDDDTFSTPAPAPSLATNKALPVVSKAVVTLDDDDFADFQAAPVQSAPAVAPAPTTKPNLMEMLNSSPAPPVMSTTTTNYGQPSAGFRNMGTGFNNMGMGGRIGAGHRPSPSVSSQSSQFSSPLVPQQTSSQNFFGGAPMKPSTPVGGAGGRPASTQPAAAKPSANFDDLWSLSLGSSGATKPGTGPANPKSIKDLEKEKALAGLWGGTSDLNTRGAMGGGFGSFGGAGGTSSSSNAGGDDLLLL
ncbi:epsin domain-containing protein [Laccaria bicolor S238N-H82]|uniref:Epsin domain-containing protein n=1 Tax=Laccaria bicolor (strain S238N-H82 / ATCC MYA-4686) TaxID=486041 RepID=B0CXA9_LACBS|nr:epsin domain-containing protein [Laccaria bicolor S238N-H82]EDR13640.1 epsin domain-containing protein [Laccaria bicolor S238N-H82]|eukprot:XP_001876138.1 epsin domain-containing protein [Laccaria bicolor S238N-H82]